MKTRINELIIRQLGELPKEIKTHDDGFIIENITGISLYDQSGSIQYLLNAQALLNQETEKRQLLAGLIEVEMEPRRIEWIDHKPIRELIEKSLSMKWSDIVDFLEDEG